VLLMAIVKTIAEYRLAGVCVCVCLYFCGEEGTHRVSFYCRCENSTESLVVTRKRERERDRHHSHFPFQCDSSSLSQTSITTLHSHHIQTNSPPLPKFRISSLLTPHSLLTLAPTSNSFVVVFIHVSRFHPTIRLLLLLALLAGQQSSSVVIFLFSLSPHRLCLGE
jgi:hypothetical protein